MQPPPASWNRVQHSARTPATAATIAAKRGRTRRYQRVSGESAPRKIRIRWTFSTTCGTRHHERNLLPKTDALFGSLRNARLWPYLADLIATFGLASAATGYGAAARIAGLWPPQGDPRQPG